MKLYQTMETFVCGLFKSLLTVLLPKTMISLTSSVDESYGKLEFWIV